MSRDHAFHAGDRRPAPRPPSTFRASLLAGPDVAVVNLSRTGLLLESDVRLRPGSGICLNLVMDGEAHRVDGRVLHVDARIVRNRMVYRAGVAFDREVWVLDDPGPRPEEPSAVPRPPIDVSVRPAGTPDLEAQAVALRAELDAERRQQREQAATIAALREALRSGEELRQELLEAHAAERERWTREQQELVERVRDAEEQVAAMVQDMKAAREAARRAAREHAGALAEREARLRERDQQLAAVRAEQAVLLQSVSQTLQEHEAREAERQQHQGRLSGQLAAAEAWCADQQDLLYRVRQQVTSMFALLDGAASHSGSAALPPGPTLVGRGRSLPAAGAARALPPAAAPADGREQTEL